MVRSKWKTPVVDVHDDEDEKQRKTKKKRMKKVYPLSFSDDACVMYWATMTKRGKRTMTMTHDEDRLCTSEQRSPPLLLPDVRRRMDP